MGQWIFLWVEDDLNDTGTIAQINKDERTVVPASLDPTCNSYSFTDMVETRFATKSVTVNLFLVSLSGQDFRSCAANLVGAKQQL